MRFVIPDCNFTVTAPGKHTDAPFGSGLAEGGDAAASMSGDTTGSGERAANDGDGEVLGVAEGVTVVPGGIAEGGEGNGETSIVGIGVNSAGVTCLTNTGIGKAETDENSAKTVAKTGKILMFLSCPNEGFEGKKYIENMYRVYEVTTLIQL